VSSYSYCPLCVDISEEFVVSPRLTGARHCSSPSLYLLPERQYYTRMNLPGRAIYSLYLWWKHIEWWLLHYKIYFRYLSIFCFSLVVFLCCWFNYSELPTRLSSYRMHQYIHWAKNGTLRASRPCVVRSVLLVITWHSCMCTANSARHLPALSETCFCQCLPALTIWDHWAFCSNSAILFCLRFA